MVTRPSIHIALILLAPEQATQACAGDTRHLRSFATEEQVQTPIGLCKRW